MKKLLAIIIIFIAVAFNVMAQPGELIIKNGSRGLYIDHEVTPSQGLFAIGRLYNAHPKFIASFNNMDLNEGLAIGQIIQIPLSDTNFTQLSKKGKPVYYIVGPNEGLLKVSNANKKVTMQKLRDWNRLTSDNMTAGSKLIVGFLVVDEANAAVSKNPVQQQPVKQQESPLIVKQIPEKNIPVSTEQNENKQVAKSVTIENNPVKNDSPVTQVLQEKNEEAKNPEPAFAKAEGNKTADGEGFFRIHFEQQLKETPASKNNTVTAGIFKTTSGWQDGKYYLLIDQVATGTIVKVINPDNNKIIYAKVLGEMNGIRQNQGFDIRISNAAASTLGISDADKFIVQVNY
ncbi:MAG: LysM peptidoglycan-binding domain-containing protein [Chitinophagaceae bacterium]